MVLKDNSGKVLKTFTAKDLSGTFPEAGTGYDGVEFAIPYSPSSQEGTSLPVWVGNTLWLADGEIDSPSDIIGVNADTFEVNKYSVGDFSDGLSYASPVRNFNFNPANKKLLYDSTNTGPDDASVYQAYQQSGKPIHLYLYDLATKQKVEIATSAGKPFNAVWIGNSTIEFNNPNGVGRLRKEI